MGAKKRYPLDVSSASFQMFVIQALDPVTELWRKACPLETAPFRFCPAKMRDALSDARTVSTGQAQPGERKADWTLLLGAFTGLMQNLSDQVSRLNEMREWVTWAIRSGKLVAYGYRLPINEQTSPVWIQGDFFRKETIDWQNSALTVGAIQFIEIKVFRPKLMQAENREGLKPRQLKKIIGRPTRTADIQNVLAEMNSAKELNLNRGVSKRSLEEIRQRVQLRYPRSSELNNEAGLGDKTLTREIRKFKKALSKL